MTHWQSAILQIFSRNVDPDYRKPWRVNNDPHSVSGSGFAIYSRDKKYIITNHHVILGSTYVECSKTGSSVRFQLKIASRSQMLDLALLEPVDADFWCGVKAIEPLTVPVIRLMDPIYAVGFPRGGINPSITSGVISRIEPLTYNGVQINLALQIDAAINSGNSGGPVFNSRDQLVGVAFSHGLGVQNICFAVPVFLVNYYLRQVRTDSDLHPGSLDIETQLTLNAGMRAFYGRAEGGSLVTRIRVGSELQIGDLLTAIDGLPIRSDGTISAVSAGALAGESAERIPFWHLLRLRLVGEKVRLSVWRREQRLELEIVITSPAPTLAPKSEIDISRNYIAIAGLHFIPLNFWFLFRRTRTLEVDDRKHQLFRYHGQWSGEIDDLKEVVVLAEIDQSMLTSGYEMNYSRLVSLNNRIIRQLSDLDEILRVEREAEYFVFLFEDANKIILDATLVRQFA